MDLHPSRVTNEPHSTGAKAGPKVIMQPPVAMYTPKRFLGHTERMVLIIMGMSMPEPIACTRRAASRKGKQNANRPIAEPAMVRTEQKQYSLRSFTRLKKKAVQVTITVAAIM